MSEENQEQEVNLEQIHEDVQAALNETPDEAGGELEAAPADELSEAEQQAIDKGWNPDGVDGKRNLSAEEFLDRESFFDEIHKLKREVRSQKQMVDALKQHNTTISEKAYERAITELKQQKVQAADNEDLGAIIQIDEKMDELRENREQSVKAEQEEAAAAPAYSPEDWSDAFTSFVDKNDWYKSDRKRQVFADSIGIQYANANPQASPEELYSYVINEINKEFAEQSQAQTKPKAAAVAGAGRRQGKQQAKKYSLADVPSEDRAIAKIVISSGVSEEDYLKQYFQQ